MRASTQPALSTVADQLPQPRRKPEIRTDSLRNAMLVTGTAAAGMVAAASLLVSALVVRAALSDRSTVWASFLVAAGTLAGTFIGSRIAQPPLTRLVTRIVRAR